MNLRLRPREFPRTGKCSTSPSCFFRGAISRITISRTTIFRLDDNLVVSIHADLSVREAERVRETYNTLSPELFQPPKHTFFSFFERNCP